MLLMAISTSLLGQMTDSLVLYDRVNIPYRSLGEEEVVIYKRHFVVIPQLFESFLKDESLLEMKIGELLYQDTIHQKLKEAYAESVAIEEKRILSLKSTIEELERGNEYIRTGLDDVLKLSKKRKRASFFRGLVAGTGIGALTVTVVAVLLKTL